MNDWADGDLYDRIDELRDEKAALIAEVERLTTERNAALSVTSSPSPPYAPPPNPSPAPGAPAAGNGAAAVEQHISRSAGARST